MIKLADNFFVALLFGRLVFMIHSNRIASFNFTRAPGSRQDVTPSVRTGSRARLQSPR